MATITTNYGFNKPEDTDNADLGIFIADNMDLIDTEINRVEGLTGGGGGGLANRSFFYAKETTGYAFPSWSQNKITYDSILRDDQTEFSNGTFTASETGIYILSSCLRLSSADTAQVFLTLYKNGAEFSRLQNLVNGTLGSATSFQVHGCTVMDLTAGDYVETYAFCNKDGLSVDPNVGGTFFSGVQIA